MDNDSDDAQPERPSIWKRLLLMLLCGIFYSVAELVMIAVVVVQFFFVLLTDQPNQRLLLFGQSLATYIYQIIQYLNFNSDYLPFPFNAWPHGTPKNGALANSYLQESSRPALSDREQSEVETASNEKPADDDKPT